jgi:SpoVK/Ycf46/Vps4 family AAA+-type ATPase
MTANDVTGLPPEFMRKGRFDEVWWVDLPTPTERVAVLNSALRANGRGKVKVDVVKVTAACDGFTGSEIAALVPDALFTAFNDGGREIETRDLVAAAGTVVPLSKTAEKKISEMREWAKGRARPATKPDAIKAQRRVRALDI